MAAAKVAVTSRVTSLENELRAAHAAGAALRTQLEEREDLIMKLNDRIRAMPHGGASPAAAAAETGHQGSAGRVSSSSAPGPASDSSPGRNLRGTATAAFDFQRGKRSPSPTPTSSPGSVPSWPVDRHLKPAGSPRHSSQPLVSEASPTGSGTRKSVQGLLARVHDMRQFVEEASSSPASAARATSSSDSNPLKGGWGGDSSAELAERLAGLSSALTDWNNTTDNGSEFEFGFRS